jgi:hypothetical protein
MKALLRLYKGRYGTIKKGEALFRVYFLFLSKARLY